MTTPRKVVLYIAMSLDGFIAGKEDDLGFLSAVEAEGEDYGYYSFVASADTVIMGRKTFDKVISMGIGQPHEDKDLIVITRQSRPILGRETYYSGSIPDLIADLKKGNGKTIYCDGGAEIVHELLKERLIDEVIISIIPVLLGDGVRLFKDNRPNQTLRLLKATPYESGLLQVHYACL